MEDIKQFLYSWLGKQHKVPNYDITTLNAKNRQRFKCELRVDGYNYIAVGNSTNKKDSQSNAALDFCQFLIRSGHLNQNDLPKFKQSETTEDVSSQPYNSLPKGLVAPHQSMGLNFNEEAQTSRQIFPYKRGPTAAYMEHVNQMSSRRMLEDAEETDTNAEIHGNWTIETAKSRLHQFMQMNRINAEYKYSATGADNNKSFFAEMTVYIAKLNKKIYANEHGSTKQSASKACALSLVRQLFHYGVIEAYTGETKKKERQKTEPFEIQIKTELKNKIANTCKLFEILPKLIFDQNTSLSLLPEKKNYFPLSEVKKISSIIPWSPPITNWNPWAGCNIDEGPLATMTLDQISLNLFENHMHQVTNDKNYQMNLRERQNLPVNNFKDAILDAVERNRVIIVRGATGCGKTTQIPQYILEAYLNAKRGAYCNIVVTQPRRISAVSVAERVAHERVEELGQSCGYSVRFESVFPRQYGGILFCTIGVLLRKLENGLRGVSHVVVDEIHERDINTDFLLVLLKDMLNIYPDLRVILMSATIDTSLFTEYFGNCPVIEITGRTYSVQEFFLEDIIQMLDFVPPIGKKRKNRSNGDDEDDDEGDGDAEVDGNDSEDVNCNAIISHEYSDKTRNSMKQISEKSLSFELVEQLIKYIYSLNQPGGILIFLPGWNLIHSLLKYLKENPFFSSNKFILLPLHSQIPREDQYKVFEDVPPGKIKIILSTNIAESSITINDIVFVIDCCKVKQKIFTSRNNMTNYATVWASKSNLDQRKGRAGRVRSGYCFYLISKARYDRLDNHGTPEIFRTPLLELALSIKLLRLGEIKEFLSRAIEPPPLDAVTEAEIALKEMNAFDSNSELTELGKILARLPIDPKLGKMIVMGCIFGLGDTMCTIAAATTFSEPFLHDGRNLRMMHKSMAGKRQSDHIALLIAFQMWRKAKYHGEDAEREFCDRKCLNMQTMRMTNEACRQLKEIMSFSGFPEECLVEINSFDQNNTDPRLDVVISLLSYALAPNVCYHLDKRKVITCDGKQALIHKNSVNCNRPGEAARFASPFFVFGEKIKTRAVSAKQMSMVSPLQLLLFASDKIDTLPNEVNKSLICLDNWITLKIELELASLIASCRSALDSVIATCTMDPNLISNPSPQITHLIDLIKMLSDQENRYVLFGKEGSSDNLTFNEPQTSSKLPRSDSTDSNNEPAKKKFFASESAQDLNTQESEDNTKDLGFFIDTRGFGRGAASNNTSFRNNSNTNFYQNNNPNNGRQFNNFEGNTSNNQFQLNNQPSNFNNNRGGFNSNFRGGGRGNNFRGGFNQRGGGMNRGGGMFGRGGFRGVGAPNRTFQNNQF